MFCLVHGSAQGPHGWDLLVRELNALGHECVCPELPFDNPEAGAATYARAIADAVAGSDRPIVAGHSISGLFLPLVPDYTSVARLVYLAAVIPQPGQSLMTQHHNNPNLFRSGLIGRNPALHSMFAKQALFETSPLQTWPKVPCSYLSCTQDRMLNSHWWEQAARQRLQIEPVRITAGHAPHVSQPAALAFILDSLAGPELRDAELLLELIEWAPHPVHRVPTFRYRMLHSETGEELGGINLRTGSTPHIERYAGHIGYSVQPKHRGRRYAARSLRLLLPVARRLGFAALWITCDPGNIASRRSAELAGGAFVETVAVPPDCIIHQSGHKEKCRYWLDLRC